MSVTAVVVGYWRERFENVERIVADLLRGSVVPERIIVLNNNPLYTDALDYLADDRVYVLSGFNTECRGKFVAALLAPANFYLLHDDDTSCGNRTLECLLRHAKRGFVTGYWGVRLSEGQAFSTGVVHSPVDALETVRVQAFHGRVMFMAHDALVRMLAVEEWVRLGTEWGLAGDDILAGLANPESCIIPMTGDECFVDLEEKGVAMQYREGYHPERDKFSIAAQWAIREHGIPHWG